MLDKEMKKRILQIKDGTKLAHFLNDNKIEIETDDEILKNHYKKYLNFGISEKDGIIYDLRNKKIK